MHLWLLRQPHHPQATPTASHVMLPSPNPSALVPWHHAPARVAGTTSNSRWVFTSIKPCPSTSNMISLAQAPMCYPPLPSSMGTCGTYLSAANNDPMGSGFPCQVSMLTIIADPSLNGLMFECLDMTTGTLAGSRNVSMIGE